MVPAAMQHEEWRGLNISVVIIPELVLTKVNITQITAHLEQLDVISLYKCTIKVNMHLTFGKA